MNIAIIGAGPAGLTAAYQLSKERSDITVYESSPRVGGLACSIRLWDQIVDIGPHRFFSSDRRVNELWLEVVGRDFEIVNRKTRILFERQLFNYPLEPYDALTKLGFFEATKCIASYGKELVSPSRSDGSFQSWVCRRFGRRLFELFFKSYSEKLWGFPCNELDADFAAQRIRKFSLSAVIKSTLCFKDPQKHRTLVDQFAYPTGGTGMVYERMAKSVRERGGRVCLNTPVRRVLLEGRNVVGVELASGARQPCDQVISTMPLTILVSQLDGVPEEVLEACRQLQFRNTILVYLEVLDRNPFADNWIYIHTPDLSFGRVTNFRNWAPQICGQSPHTILALEYWCNSNDELWNRSDEALSAQAREELLRSGLLDPSDKFGRSYVLRVPKSYPVYRQGYRALLQTIQEYLNTVRGLQVIGRYGSFKYNNQDHSILMGRMAAENILRAQHHVLWNVNTDYETYQESCTITETGLVVNRTE